MYTYFWHQYSNGLNELSALSAHLMFRYGPALFLSCECYNDATLLWALIFVAHLEYVRNNADSPIYIYIYI